MSRNFSEGVKPVEKVGAGTCRLCYEIRNTELQRKNGQYLPRLCRFHMELSVCDRRHAHGHNNKTTLYMVKVGKNYIKQLHNPMIHFWEQFQQHWYGHIYTKLFPKLITNELKSVIYFLEIYQHTQFQYPTLLLTMLQHLLKSHALLISFSQKWKFLCIFFHPHK